MKAGNNCRINSGNDKIFKNFIDFNNKKNLKNIAIINIFSFKPNRNTIFKKPIACSLTNPNLINANIPIFRKLILLYISLVRAIDGSADDL